MSGESAQNAPKSGGKNPEDPSGVEAGRLDQAFERLRSGRAVRRYRGAKAVRVCSADDLELDALAIVEADGHSIGILRVDGELYGIRNECPHNGAPLCRGGISGTYPPTAVHTFTAGELDGRILACPWHGRQFDVVTGQSLYDPDVHALTYEVWEEDGGVFVRV